MRLGFLLTLIKALLQLSKRLGKGVFSRVFLLFGGGLYTWIGITVYVLYANLPAINQFLATGNPIPVFVSFGTNLANADAVILQQTQLILKGGLEGIQYQEALAAVIGNVAYIVWYFKAFLKGLRQWDPNIPAVLVLILSSMFYALTVALVRDGLPFQGMWLFLENLGQIVDFDRVFEFIDPDLAGNSTVVSGNRSVEALNRSFRNGA